MPVQRRIRSALRQFLRSEALGGVVLLAAAALAMLVANSALGESYAHALHAPIGPEVSPKLGPLTAHLLVNDGLMALFFLLVGLEIKREWTDGRLASWRQRRLPIIAALAGMLVPAHIYIFATLGEPELARGWAIPAATDIAFALGVLALLGKRAPASLKLLLTTIAIVDDIGAVAIIAVAYTASLNMLALGAAVAVLAAAALMNRRGVTAIWPYLFAFAALWYAVLMSGVHATVAGVVAAMMVPVRPTPGAPDAEDSTLHRLEHGLSGWVAYAIVPIFAFANAGVSLGGIAPSALLSALPLGIGLGLFVGKQVGIFGAIWLSVRLGWASRPRNASWTQLYGLSLLCGIGFTMSLFIAALAFVGNPAMIEEAKLGVLIGSAASALAGFLVLRFASATVPLRGKKD